MFAEQGCEITVHRRRGVNPGKVGRLFQARKDRVGNLRSRNASLAVTGRHVARPIPNVFDALSHFRSQIDDRMAAFRFAHVFRPENLHEIAGTRFGKLIKVPAEPELVKQPGGSGTVCVPPAPDALTIALIANDQMVKRSHIQVELPALAQAFEGSNEHEIGGAGAKTRGRGRRQNEELAGLEVGSGLQANLGHAPDGILAALGHPANLLQDQGVDILGHGQAGAQTAPEDDQKSSFPHKCK